LIDKDARAYRMRVAQKVLCVVWFVNAAPVQASGVDTSLVRRKTARLSLQSILRPPSVRQLPTSVVFLMGALGDEGFAALLTQNPTQSNTTRMLTTTREWSKERWARRYR